MKALPKMHKIFLILLAVLFHAGVSAQLKVILDTDPGYDPDDVGCMAMLHTMASQDECEILAIVNSTHYQESTLCISAINTFYNRRAIPVGDYKGYGEKLTAPEDTYISYVSAKYPRDLKTWKNSQDAISLYREILASAADKSITIVITGTMHNFHGLLNSVACIFSELSGKDLVEQKVKLVATMGGNFIDGRGFDRTNWGGSDTLCSYTSWSCLDEERNAMCRYVVEICPAPLVASGWEVGCGDYFNSNYGNVMTGQELKQLDSMHITRRSYETHFDFRGSQDYIDRHSNDQCALLYAIRGEGENFSAWLNGDITLSEAGICTWEAGKGKQGYIQKKRDKDLIADEIEALMMGDILKPDQSPPESPAKLEFKETNKNFELSWLTSEDPDPGSWVVAYHIYRNEEFLGSSYGLKYIREKQKFKAGTYEVRAVNVNRIESSGTFLELPLER